MIDGCGREIDYVRISVTDRCNLRCVYCMPEEGVPLVSHCDILSYNEIQKLAFVFVKLGIRKIKLTGGEPLVRKGLPDLVKQLKQVPGIEQVTLTTNGLLLGEQMENLALAGIDGINLSLDTLNPEIFQQITGNSGVEKALAGLFKALQYPQIPVKINCVPMVVPGQDLTELAGLAKEYPVHVRFIEMMPIGLGKQFGIRKEDDILTELERQYGPYEVFDGKLGNGPGHYYTFPDFKGKIGFISAISHKFCGQCNRVRLTSQGYLKTCLQYDVGVDLRKILRGGGSEAELMQAVANAIGQKPVGHCFGEDAGEHVERHVMAQIGG